MVLSAIPGKGIRWTGGVNSRQEGGYITIIESERGGETSRSQHLAGVAIEVAKWRSERGTALKTSAFKFLSVERWESM